MNRYVLFSFVLLLSVASSANVKIINTRYDAAHDALVITGEFPGKCLPHKLELTPDPKKSSTLSYRFLLSVTNAQDPCNASNRITQSFDMSSVGERPAQVLVSPNADGSGAYQVTIPTFSSSPIEKISQRPDGQLSVTVKAKGTLTSNRFFVDITDTCLGNNPPRCEAVIRDRQGAFALTGSSNALPLTLPLPSGFGPVTLVFKLTNGTQKTFQTR